MADSKITGLTELSAAPSAGDMLLVVDVSDTTMAATGTNKKVDATRLVAQGGTANISILTVPTIKATSASTGTITVNSPSSSTPLIDLVGGSGNRLALRTADVVTDATIKQSRFVSRHYTNAEEDVTLLFSSNSSTNNQIYVGGNISTFNAASLIAFFCAANTTTLTGTEILRLTSSLALFTVPIYGSLSSAGSLTLSSTSHATKGKIYLGANAAFDELNTRLGVGTISPARGLQVHGASDSYVRVSSNTFTSGIEFGFDGTNAYLWNYQNNDIIFATNNAEKMRITSAGNITTSGTITCVDLVETSSKEEKENFSYVTGVLDKLSKVKAYYYNDKQDSKEVKQTKIGLLAEEFQDDFPEMVAPVEVLEKGETRQTRGLKYTRLVTLAIQGINELTEIQKRILDRLETLEQKTLTLKEI